MYTTVVLRYVLIFHRVLLFYFSIFTDLPYLISMTVSFKCFFTYCMFFLHCCSCCSLFVEYPPYSHSSTLLNGTLWEIWEHEGDRGRVVTKSEIQSEIGQKWGWMIVIHPHFRELVSESLHQRACIRELASESLHQRACIRELASESLHQRAWIRELESESLLATFYLSLSIFRSSSYLINIRIQSRASM